MAPSGWYADPLGRHEKRYFNGLVWTDRVADGGQASSDPIGNVNPRVPFDPGYMDRAPARRAVRPPPSSNGPAAAGLILGAIGAVAASLSPFGFIVGAVLGLVGLEFGLRGRRNARRGAPANGLAIAGVVLGSLAVVVAVYYGSTYYSLTDKVHDAFASSSTPVVDANAVRDVVRVTSCARVGNGVEARGTIVNTSKRKQEYRVTIAFHVGAITVDGTATTSAIAAGKHGTWKVGDAQAAFTPTSCSVAPRVPQSP